MDRTEAQFSGFAQGDGLVAHPDFVSRIRKLVADRAVWPFLVVVSTPIFQLFDSVRKGEEPALVQTFRSEASIKDLNENIFRRFA